jgi:hypothetical protein
MPSNNDVEGLRLDRELATSNVNRAATLVGSSTAVFTFYSSFFTHVILPVRLTRFSFRSL